MEGVFCAAQQWQWVQVLHSRRHSRDLSTRCPCVCEGTAPSRQPSRHQSRGPDICDRYQVSWQSAQRQKCKVVAGELWPGCTWCMRLTCMHLRQS